MAADQAAEAAAAEAAGDDAAAAEVELAPAGPPPGTPPGLLAAVMRLADGWTTSLFGSEGPDAQDSAAAAGGSEQPAASASLAAGEQAEAADADGVADEDGQGSVAASDDGWASPGSLDELVTAASELPPNSALATVAASRPQRGALAFLTPLPQPRWDAEDDSAGGSQEEGVASSCKGDGGCSGQPIAEGESSCCKTSGS